MSAAFGATRPSIYFVEALANFGGDTSSKIDLPCLVPLHEDDRLHLRRLGCDLDVGDVALDLDLHVLLGGDELTEDEATEGLIVLALPIGKAALEERRVEELEPLARLQPTAGFFL